MATRTIPQTDLEEFKNSYNALLQTFRDLKEQEHIDEPRLKQLNEELSVVSKQNLDAAIRIKLLEIELEGTTENLLDRFQAEFQQKDERISELKQKLEDKEHEAERKANQHQNILNNLKLKYDERVQYLNEKKGEYNSLIQAANDNNLEEENKINELKRSKEFLEAKLKDIQFKIDNPKTENVQIPTDLTKQISELQEQIKKQEERRKELESYLSGKDVRKNEALENIKKEYQPKITQEEKRIADLKQQVLQKQAELDREDQLVKRVEVLKARRNEVLTDLRSKEQLAVKLQVEEENLRVAKKDLKESKKQKNLSHEELEAEIIRLKEEHEKLFASFDSIKKANHQTLEDIQTINHQLQEIKKRQNTKIGKKEMDQLKQQQSDLEKAIEREKQRQVTLKQLQKNYRPQSEFKELKNEQEILKTKVNGLTFISRDSIKLQREAEVLRKRLQAIKDNEESTIQQLRAQHQELRASVADLENQSKLINKDLNDQNFKLNAYIKAFPDHQEKKSELKKLHKKAEEQKVKEKKQKEREQLEQKKSTTLSEQDQLDDILESISTPESNVKSLRSYSFVLIVGILILSFLWLIFSRY